MGSVDVEMVELVVISQSPSSPGRREEARAGHQDSVRDSGHAVAHGPNGT